MSGDFSMRQKKGAARMEYPIMLGGREAGRLSVCAEGLFTVYEATIPGRQELLRLSVYGGGLEGYLGVMQPHSGGLYLRRRMSRAQAKAMPPRPEYAAPSGLGGGGGAATADETPIAPEDRDTSADSRVSAPEEAGTLAAPEPAGDREGGQLWHMRADGSLAAFDARGCIIALPAELRREARGAVIRRINGQSYMLFRY